MRRRPLWWRRFLSYLIPRRKMEIIEGDTLPTRLPLWNLVVARDEDEDWSVGLRCPCGCGRRLEMMLLKQVKPRWDIAIDRNGHVSLHPSIWVREGCKSHFWLRSGKVVWCE